jgi:hypothetical protein
MFDIINSVLLKHPENAAGSCHTPVHAGQKTSLIENWMMRGLLVACPVA